MKPAAALLAVICLFQAGPAQALDIVVQYCSNNERADLKVNIFNGSDSIRFAPASSGLLRPGESRLYSCKGESCGYSLIYPISLPRPAAGNMSNLANGSTLDKMDDRGTPTDSPRLCFSTRYSDDGIRLLNSTLDLNKNCSC